MNEARVVFMGSPEFSIPTLNALNVHYPVVGVVTQPDRPAGRGKVLTSPAVKNLALDLGLPYIQPERVRSPEAMTVIKGWSPDLIVVAAFGQILKPDLLDLPPLGCINVHASLLPRWRGASPIQAAILNGDSETGVTIMKMDPGMDTGPVYAQRACPVDAADTAGTLGIRLSELGAELLVEVLPDIISGALKPAPQDETLATSTRLIGKEEGLLDFSQDAASLVRKVRAFTPSPGAYFLWQEKPLKVLRAHVEPGAPGEPGTRLAVKGQPAVSASNGSIVFDEVQPAGKKPMPGKSFLAGARNWASG